MDSRTDLSISSELDFELDDIPMDVFDLSDRGLTVESLTAGHGMPENGASCCTGGSDSCACCGHASCCSPAC